MKWSATNAFRAATGILAVAILSLAGYVVLRVRLLNIGPAPAAAGSAEAHWPAPATIPGHAWKVFRGGSAAAASVSSGPASERFRLAGTFYVYSGDEQDAPRKAILDDLKSGQQQIVGTGDRIEEFEIARIADDRVTVRSRGGDTDLFLSFLGAAGSESTSSTGAVASTGSDQEVLLDHSRFGGRVGYNRWVFKRDELVRYYDEILNDPERVAALFVSMKPSYTNDQIDGYYLDPEGEREFFSAIGLEKGDVIRKVNSMNMTSQKRAEYFIGEFVKNRLNAFVLDIDREGKPEKLVYLLR